MNNKSLIFSVLFIITFFGTIEKIFSQETKPGFKTTGNGLSIGNIFLSDGKHFINRTQYTYGEKIYINFENIQGFVKTDDLWYPGMELYVISEKGDTAMANKDMYAQFVEGIDNNPISLNCNVIVAKPIHSSEKYTIYVKVFDKKGSGTFSLSFDFNVIANKHITVDEHKMSCKEIYLYSKERGITITENRAGFDEHIYLLFEGIKGVKNKKGKGEIGLSMKAVDADGNVIVQQEDLFAERDFNISDIQNQIAPSLIIKKGLLVNPVYYEVIIWDKNSKSRITASVNLEIL